MHLNFWVTIQFPLANQSKRLVIFPELRWSCGRIIILVWGTILVFKENGMQQFESFWTVLSIFVFLNQDKFNERRPSKTTSLIHSLFRCHFYTSILRMISQNYEFLSKLYFCVTFGVEECINASCGYDGYFQKYCQI